MKIEVVQCGMCKHYDSEQYCEVWEQYITNDAFYCACGVKADRKTESNSEIPNNSTISKMEQVDKDINVRSKTEPQTDCKDCKYAWWNSEAKRYECMVERCRYKERSE